MNIHYLYYLPGTQYGVDVDQLRLPLQVLTEFLVSESFDGAGQENSTTVPTTNLSFAMVLVTATETSPIFVIAGHSVCFIRFLCISCFEIKIL